MQNDKISTKKLSAKYQEEERKARSPCQNLWLTVLMQAIRQACTEENSPEKSEALKWLNKRKTPPKPGDVLWICEQVDFFLFDHLLNIVKNGTNEERLALKKALT